MFVHIQEIQQRRKALDAQDAVWLQEVAAYDRSEEWRAAGYSSAAAALADVCRMDEADARASVARARKLPLPNAGPEERHPSGVE